MAFQNLRSHSGDCSQNSCSVNIFCVDHESNRVLGNVYKESIPEIFTSEIIHMPCNLLLVIHSDYNTKDIGGKAIDAALAGVDVLRTPRQLTRAEPFIQVWPSPLVAGPTNIPARTFKRWSKSEWAFIDGVSIYRRTCLSRLLIYYVKTAIHAAELDQSYRTSSAAEVQRSITELLFAEQAFITHHSPVHSCWGLRRVDVVMARRECGEDFRSNYSNEYFISKIPHLECRPFWMFEESSTPYKWCEFPISPPRT